MGNPKTEEVARAARHSPSTGWNNNVQWNMNQYHACTLACPWIKLIFRVRDSAAY